MKLENCCKECGDGTEPGREVCKECERKRMATWAPPEMRGWYVRGVRKR